MNKPNFKVIDDKGRVLIPKPIRSALKIENGDIVGITVEGSRIALKKAIILSDDSIPIEAKECYVQAVVREFDGKALIDLLELIARLIQEVENKKKPE